jgi:hypothetical protein
MEIAKGLTVFLLRSGELGIKLAYSAFTVTIRLSVKADSHIACRAAEGLECVFPI